MSDAGQDDESSLHEDEKERPAPAAKADASAVGPSGSPAPVPAATAPTRKLTSAEVRQKFGRTSIGIAPPALGSQAPRSRPPVPLPSGTTGTRTSRPPPPAPVGRPPQVPGSVPRSGPPSAFNDTVIAGPAIPAPPRVPSVAPPVTAPPSTPRLPPSVNPAPIVPRRRTPERGFPAAKPVGASVTGPPPPVPPLPLAPPVVKEKAEPPGTPPLIRIPHGGVLGSTSKPLGIDRSGTLLCEILVRNGAVTQDVVDKAIALQEERGGQIGRILVSLGACSEEAIARALIEQLRARKDEGHWSDISAAARERKDVVGLKVLTRPVRTVMTLLLTDMFSLVLAALLATSVHWLRTYSELQTIDWTAWLVVGPSIALCMLTFLGLELYSPMAKSTPDEIRDITFASSLVHLGASLLSTLGDLPIVKWGIFVRGVWWAATLFLVPVIRSLVRNYLSVQPWWGIPVCVLGAAKTGRLIVRTLKAQPRSVGSPGTELEFAL